MFDTLVKLQIHLLFKSDPKL